VRIIHAPYTANRWGRPARRALALLGGLLTLAAGCRQLLPTPVSEARAPLSAAAPLQLAEGGMTRYAILLPAEAAPYEATAAGELQTYLKRLTGATFAVVREGLADVRQPVIAVGRTRRFAQVFPEVDLAALEPDALVAKTQGRDLYLAGEGTRGTLYAVCDFLERECGVRWWTPFEESVPQKSDLAVAPPDRVYAPPFVYRETHSQLFNDTLLNNQHLKRTAGLEERRRFAVRCKNNTLALLDIPPEWGGNLRIVDLRQAADRRMYQEYNHFISVDEFGKSHPEWFCERNGRRQSRAVHHAQLCLANEAMRAEFIRRAKAWVDALPGQTTFVLMHNDNEYYCQCAACAAVDAEEGSPSGSQMRFMNAVTTALVQHRPGLRVWMDAYWYSTQPPKLTRPHASLGPILCTPIKSQRLDRDADFLAKLDAWKAVAPQVVIWDYVVNFGSFVNPWPNLRHLGPNIRTLAANGVYGVFSQGNAFNTVSDAEELKSWVIAHMLWDPSQDPDALIAEFVRGYYGKAAQPVMAYLDHIAACGGDLPGGLPGAETATGWLDLAAMNRATQLLDEARAAAADDPALEPRVARLRLCLDHQWLLGWRHYRDQADRAGQPFLGPPTALQALAGFRRDNARFGSTHDAEHYGYGTMAQQLGTIERALTVLGGEPPPPPHDALPPEDRILFQEDALQRVGRLATVVSDPLASNGKALRTACDHKDWNIQVTDKFLRTLCRMTGLNGKWKVIAWVRADAKAARGDALQVGIWSYRARALCVTRTVKIEELDPKGYTPVEVGAIDFDQDAEKVSIWVAPLENPLAVDAIYVDRVLLVRDGGAK
jgi:hypothetical protein